MNSEEQHVTKKTKHLCLSTKNKWHCCGGEAVPLSKMPNPLEFSNLNILTLILPHTKKNLAKTSIKKLKFISKYNYSQEKCTKKTNKQKNSYQTWWGRGNGNREQSKNWECAELLYLGPCFVIKLRSLQLLNLQTKSLREINILDPWSKVWLI